MITTSTRPRARRPAPAEAGANLLVHDLKNLACRLGALLQNLDEHYDDPSFKRTALDMLDDTVVHLQRLAKDLREHDGRVVVKLKVELNHVVQQALSDTRPDLLEGIEVLEHYAPLPLIWGDGFLLRSAFACAIDNALEAMGGRGRLGIATARFRRRQRESVTVEIADTGPGMSEEFLKERLGAPFSSTKEDGMGLGVYTFRQVAALHGGTVRILSAEGEGTRVRFHFPVVDR
jgi:signal transduction histidine kinase